MKTRNPLEGLVQAAILAANPHNSQPWKFHVTDDSIDVFADHSRQIGVIDPLLREMHIGIGCAVENLLLAAGAAGYAWNFEPPVAVNISELEPIIRIRLKPGTVQLSPLYAAIAIRHTNRGRYDRATPISPDFFRALSDVGTSNSAPRIFWFQQAEERREFGRLVIAATEAIIDDKEQSASSAKWMRTNWSEIQQHRDGLTYDAQVLTAGRRALAKFLPQLSQKQSDNFWLSATRDVQVASASAFGLVSVRNPEDPQQLLDAGRMWQRMHLFATVHGVAMQPLNQPLERRDREIQLGLPSSQAWTLANLQQDNTWHGVMPFRLGFPEQTASASPRRALASILV